ncbi:MAG: hypothetical protein RQ756_00640, partial [Flavobacteriaceae bacterium]|nr:hypothetical protein [Flavobacteriaceae bacterium]
KEFGEKLKSFLDKHKDASFDNGEIEEIEVEEIEVEEISDNQVAFNEVAVAPVAVGCEGMTDEASKDCFSTKLSEYVFQNFDTKVADGLTNFNSGDRIRISVVFKINSLGEITNIQARAPHQAFEEEAKRAIASFNQIKEPAKDKNGNSVGIVYSLPIIFEIK